MPITQNMCLGCNEIYDILCSGNCQRCEECCSCNRCESCGTIPCICFHCPACGRREGGECEHCGYGIVCCCSCSYCDSCGSNHDGGSCSNCGFCLECCDCHHVGYMDHPIVPSEFWRTSSLKEHKFNPSKRFIGVEIEVAIAQSENRIHEVCNKWKCSIGEDGSLPDTGFEIRTYPAQGDVFCKLITDLCGALKSDGAKVNNSCGLHVHLSADKDTYWDIRKIIRLYAYLEQSLFSLMHESRRNSHYCHACGPNYTQHLNNLNNSLISNPFSLKKKNKEKARIFRQNIPMMLYGSTDTRRTRIQERPGCRYSALNIHSWFFRKTIENRLHSGTVNANKIICWSTLFAAILDRANQMSEKEIMKLKRKPMGLIMDIAPNDNVREYIKNRFTKYNPNKRFEEML